MTIVKKKSLLFSVNTEVLSSNKMLTFGDPQQQFLDPDGVDREVYMPLESESDEGLTFWIFNTGSSGMLNIKNNNGSQKYASIRSKDVVKISIVTNHWKPSIGLTGGSGGSGGSGKTGETGETGGSGGSGKTGDTGGTGGTGTSVMVGNKNGANSILPVFCSTIDLTTYDPDLKGFYGGFTDGRYGYFVPYDNSSPFGKIARLDLLDFSTVNTLDLTTY